MTQFVQKQQVLVDYSNRCAVALIYDEMLAVIPFVPSRVSSNSANSTAGEKAGSTAERDSSAESSSKKAMAPSYLVHLPELGITNIKDIKFLHGYYEPTIMVLYEPTGTWAGRLAKTRNTVAVAIVELDITLRRQMLIWSIDKLPHDCYRICPLKFPGGAVIFSANALLFVDHSSKYRLTLNTFGDSASVDPDVVGKYVMEKSKMPISLDDAKFTFLSDTVALLSVESGALYFMTIFSDGRSVTHIDLASAGSSIVTTGLCTLNDRYFFVAARLANSLLLSYTPHVDQSVKKVKEEAGDGRQKFGTFTDWCDPEYLDENVVDLLSEVKSTKINEADDIATLHKVKKYDLKRVDTLACIAPAGDAFLRPKDDPEEPADPPTTDPAYVPLEDHIRARHKKQDPNAIFDVVAACGYERSGGLCIISKSLPQHVVDECEMPGVMGAWSLYAIPDTPSTSQNSAANMLSASSNNGMDVADADDLPARSKNAKRQAPTDVPAADADGATEEAQGDENNIRNGEGEENGEYDAGEEEEPQHKVLMFTSTQQTHILVETGAGPALISDKHDFLDKEETLGAGNVCSGRRIVQIGYYEVLVLNSDFKAVQRLQLGTDSEGSDLYAIWSSILDPYVLIMTNEHQLILFEANQETLQLDRLTMARFDSYNNSQSAKIVTLNMFIDSNNMVGFNTLNADGKAKMESMQQNLSHSSADLSRSGGIFPPNIDTPEGDNILTEDEANDMGTDPVEIELYANAKEFSTSKRGPKSVQDAIKLQTLTRAIHPAYLDRPFFFALAREDGQFEIWKLSTAEAPVDSIIPVSLVFRCSNLHNGRQFMDHENDVKKQIGGQMDGEICIASVGTQHSLPHLVVKLDDGTIYAYSCHYYKSALVSEKFLPVRFVRMPLNAICHNLPLPEHSKNAQGEVIERPEVDKNLSVITTVRRSLTHPTLTPFFGLAGGRYSGIFVSGDSPLWLFCERDYLRPQRVSENKRRNSYASSVAAFAPLNTASCPYGFIMAQEGKIQMLTLDDDWDVEFAAGGSLCARRIELQETVHALSYDRESHFVVATTSVRKKEMLRYLRGAADDKREADLAKKIAEGTAQPLVYDMSTLDPRLPPIWEDMYSVKLLDPDTWETVASYECAPEEVAIAKCMDLMNYIPLPPIDPTPAAVLGTTFAAKRIVAPFKKVPTLIVGTAIVRGEDAACKGRVIVLDIIQDPDNWKRDGSDESYDEDGAPKGRRRKARLELRTERACLQPVTTLNSLDGHLLVAEGRSFYVYQLRVEEGLYRIGFLDAQLSTVSVTVVRNYILYGDMHHSVRLMRWLKAPHNWLQLVAKDASPLEAIGTGALLEGDRVTWLVSDERGNIFMHAFTPNPELVPTFEPVGDFHVGSKVRQMLRFRVGALPSDEPDKLRNHGCVLAALDGSLSYIVPLPAPLFNLLKKLESHLVSSLEHVAGLHPFAFRYPKPSRRMAHPHHRSVLDGDLLWRFMHLERTKQEELARAINVNATFIIDLFCRLSMQSTLE